MKLDDAQNDRWLWIIFGLMLLLVLFNSSFRVFNHDEFEAIHSSWKVLNTGLVFRDFFQHHHPLLYFISTPVIAIVGENIATLFVLRGMALGILLATFLVTYFIATKLFDRRTALLSIVFLASMRIFITRAIEVRPDTPQVLFGLLCILFLFSFYHKRSYRDLVLSAVSLAISFLFLQKAILLIFLVGAIMTVDIFRREISTKDMLLYFIVFLATLAPFFIYIIITGSLDNYLFFAWIINLDLPGSFSPLSNTLNTLRRNTLVWIFYFPGLWLVLRPKNRDANRIRLAIISTGLLASVYFARLPNPQYFMHSIPLISILAAFAIRTFLSANPKRLLIIIIIGTAIPAFALAKKPIKKPNFAQLERVKYVLSITDKTDSNHDSEITFNLFRQDTDFFWFMIVPGTTKLSTKITMTDFNGFYPCESIGKVKPIVVADHILLKDCPYIEADYKRSKRYKDMFLRVNSG